MRGLSAIAVILCCAASFASAQQPVPLSETPEVPPPASAPAPASGEVDAVPPAARPARSLVVQTPEPQVQIPLMTIDQDALFMRSAWGKRAQAELERRGRALAEENEELARALSREEQELSELRKTLPAEDFRARADEFDKRVVEVRRERDTKTTELQHYADLERDAFQQAVLPILARMMQERGAVAVLDLRVLFVSADAIDVTDDLIKEVDAVAGAGPAAGVTEDAGGAEDRPAAPTAPEAASPEQGEGQGGGSDLLPHAPDQSAESGDSAE